MVAVVEKDEDLHYYSKDGIKEVLAAEVTDKEDVSFLTAITIAPLMVEVRNGDKVEYVLSNYPTVDIMTVVSEDYPTGIFMSPGAHTIIVLNEKRTVLEYDLLSKLHPIKDASTYLWLEEPWNKDSELGRYGEWFRSDVYKDSIKPFDGTLGWADTVKIEGED